MKIKTRLIIEKTTVDRKIIKEYDGWSRSWTRHLFDVMYPLLAAGVNSLAGINDISSTGRAISTTDTVTLTGNLCIASPPGLAAVCIVDGNATGSNIGIMGDNGANNHPFSGQELGIQVGTGVAAATPSDDKLGTKIAHGEGAGALLYGGTELFGLTFANPNGQFTIRRYFTNVLGGAIAVTESGIYAPARNTGQRGYPFCICHDVFGAVTVNNGELLSVTYVPQITV